MNRFFVLIVSIVVLTLGARAEDPLRVFIRGGKKSHRPNAHEHERFLQDWQKLLGERGAKCDGALDWPTAAQLAVTDVLVMYAQEGGNATAEQKANLEVFTKRGGGIVVIHTASVSDDPVWWKSVIGGSWVQGQTKFNEGPIHIYYTENQQLGGGHPITKGASNFQINDEIYYDMDIAPEVRVLATTYTPKVPSNRKVATGGKINVYDIQPQMWTYEKDKYRAVVCIPGHLYSTFEKPHFKAILLRSIAWAGKRANIDEFCKEEEIASLTYPEGGPQKPADTVKALEIHPDFTLTLVAAEPLINKPMNFDWAPDGSLWVAETPEYPNGRRGMRPDYRGKEWKDRGGLDPTPGLQSRKGQDKVSRLVDTNGDGVMDTKTVFYEGLDLVTGLVFYKDGVIVTQAPDILWLRDTDADGKCDKVEKLYTGLGTNDTHAVINNPRWGWDGWIYCTHGYNRGDVTSGDGKKAFGKMSAGVVRFKPDGSAFEQFSSKSGNTWGLSITTDNRVLWTQPTSGTLLNESLLPESALARGKLGNTTSFFNIIGAQKSYAAMTWDQLPYAQIDRVGDFTAGAGCAIYDGGSWPKEYNGDYFVTEPTINIVSHQRLTPKGTSFSAAKLAGREETEFLRSKDMWWRPIEVRIGPDGALYIADFYNQAVIHNDTRGPDHNDTNAAVRPDRDHYFGRIWRVDHKQAKATAVPDLTKAQPAVLAEALEHPNRAVRMTASRLLIELGGRPGVELDAVIDPIINRRKEDWATATAETKIASLWTLAPLFLDKEIFALARGDKDPTVRRNAALICEANGVSGAEGLIGDENATVRLAALRALSAGKVSESAAKDIVAAWPKFDDDYQRSAALGAASVNAWASLAAAFDQGAAGNLVGALAQTLSASDAAKLVVLLAAKPASFDALKCVALDALAKNSSRPELDADLQAALVKLMAGACLKSALPVVAKWDQKGAFKEELAGVTRDLVATLSNASASENERIVAARCLVGLAATDKGLMPTLLKELADKNSATFEREFIGVLSETGDLTVGSALVAGFAQLPVETQAVAFEAIIKRADWVGALLDALQSKQLPLSLFNAAACSRLRTHPNRAVASRAAKLIDELNPGAKLKKELLAKLGPIVEQPGDVEKGKAAFASTCAVCHAFGGIGADIGPGLTGMGTHGAGELLAAIVDPNAEVDPSFRQWNVETRDGNSFAGVIASENPTTLTLKSLAGLQQVKVADIKSRVDTGLSLMPEGFGGLPPEMLRDIIAYMQSVDGGRFRVVDLKASFTVNSRQLPFASQGQKPESLEFGRFGTMNVGDVPFQVVDSRKSSMGNNLLILKGGPADSAARQLPARVEVPVGGFKANRLHFIGGVASGGYPGKGALSPAMKVTVVFSDAKTEEFICQNGVEFADFSTRVEVPGSKFVELVKGRQVRYFAKDLQRTAPIDKLILESAGEGAPITIGITAEFVSPKP